MSNETHDAIMTAIQTYSEENGKFVDKGVKASATRARKTKNDLSAYNTLPSVLKLSSLFSLCYWII